MSTIVIEATDRAREYVKRLYMTRLSIVESAGRITDVCSDMLDSPDIRSVDGSAKAAMRSAQDDIDAIECAVKTLGFSVDEHGEIKRCVASVQFSHLALYINAVENWPADSVSIFRAVLSAFGITYTAGDHCAIRYTYTPEER